MRKICNERRSAQGVWRRWMSFLVGGCVALTLVASAVAEEVTGYWLGTSSYKLKEPAQWLDGVRPGRWSTGADGAVEGDLGGTMIFDEHLTGWGTQLLSESFVSVKNMIWQGAVKETYFASWGSNQFYLEPGGKFEVKASATAVPYYQAASGGVLGLTGLTEKGQTLDIINDSLNGTLVLNNLYAKNADASKDQFYPLFRLSGQGDIKILGDGDTQFTAPANGRSVLNLELAQTGSGKLILDSTIFKAWQLHVPESETLRTIEIPEGKLFRLIGVGDAAEKYALDIDTDTAMTGAGLLDFGLFGYNPSYINIAAGKTLTIACNLKDEYNGGTMGVVVNGGGTLEFAASCQNSMRGNPRYESSTTIKTPIIGLQSSTTSPLGAGTELQMANNARLVYTGTGEETDRTFYQRWGGAVHLVQAGTGNLEFSGTVAAGLDQAVTIDVDNDTEHEIVFSGVVRDSLTAGGQLSIRKNGSGVWRVTCAATHTGTTTVNAGTLALSEDGSLEHSAVILNGGALRIENAPTLASLTFKANQTSALVLAENLTYELASATFESGAKVAITVASCAQLTLPTANTGIENASVAVTLASGAQLKLAGLAAGLTPAWLTVNGTFGVVDAEGNVRALDALADEDIDARGGVIPNGADKVVAISLADGSVDGVTLAEPTTAALLLRQEQDKVDAVVALKDGETLKADAFVTAAGAKPLAFAAPEGGSATVTGVNGAPLFAGSFGLDGVVALAAGAKVEDGSSFALTGEPTLAGALDFLGEATVSGEGRLLTADGSSVTVTGDAVTLTDASIVSVTPLARTSPVSVGAANGVGKLIVDGGVISNKVNVGGSNGESALVIKDGLIHNPQPGDNDWYSTIGQNGSTYLRVEGGSYTETKHGQWGASPSQVVVDQTGGSVTFKGEAALGNWETQLSYYLTGGEFACTSLSLPFWNSGVANPNRLSFALTVGGTDSGAAKCSSSYIILGRISTYADTANASADISAVNVIDGGELAACVVYRDSGYPRSARCTSRAFVNFDGGTFKMLLNRAPFGVPEDRRATVGGDLGVDRITVFEKGATIDVNNYVATNFVPFSVPGGQGLASVPVPTAIAEATFTAPPAVVIIGDGEGATAHPVFDHVTRKVTGVKVLSAGWGYTSARARFCHGGKKTRVETDCTLGPVKGGPLTITGRGLFGLDCASEVTDVTLGGTVKVRALRDGVFPATTKLTLAGATLDLENHALNVAEVVPGAARSTVLNGTVAAGGLTIDYAAACAGTPGTFDASGVSFGAGATLKLDGFTVDSLEGQRRIKLLTLASADQMAALLTLDAGAVLPENWKLVAKGAELVLAKQLPLVILCR